MLFSDCYLAFGDFLFTLFIITNLCLFSFREEELQMQKLKKRKIKADPRLSFADDFENDNDEEDEENSKHFSHCVLFVVVVSIFSQENDLMQLIQGMFSGTCKTILCRLYVPVVICYCV